MHRHGIRGTIVLSPMSRVVTRALSSLVDVDVRSEDQKTKGAATAIDDHLVVVAFARSVHWVVRCWLRPATRRTAFWNFYFGSMTGAGSTLQPYSHPHGHQPPSSAVRLGSRVSGWLWVTIDISLVSSHGTIYEGKVNRPYSAASYATHAARHNRRPLWRWACRVLLHVGRVSTQTTCSVVGHVNTTWKWEHESLYCGTVSYG